MLSDNIIRFSSALKYQLLDIHQYQLINNSIDILLTSCLLNIKKKKKPMALPGIF